ncbi:MAG: hypothetical protein M3511_00130, partial [Deinococcota bacterium]|nr:hypothetical protein [Deinococcota bacterium]
MKRHRFLLFTALLFTTSMLWLTVAAASSHAQENQEHMGGAAVVTLMPVAEHGLPEGFGEEEWLAARGVAFVTTSDAGEDTIMVAASGLVPNGIYTLWWVIEEPEMEVGPAGGLPANTFTADREGNARAIITAPTDNDYQTLLIAYHADYRTYGDEPGQMGEVTFSQLMGPFPRSAGMNAMSQTQTGMGDMQTGDMQMSMDMMGEGAQLTALAETNLDTLPAGPLAWIALDLGALREVNVTSPAPGFLYAHEGTHSATADGTEVMLEQGESVFVPEGSEVMLASGQGLWHIVLADPEAELPEELEGATVAFTSGELEGLPEGPAALRFLLVELPMMGSATTVHTHPGPEYIYVMEGDIDYETGLADTETLTVGDDRALPADTAVQKRNPSDQRVTFLSWFIV